MATIFSQQDHLFMKQALELATQAYHLGEVPIAAVVVDINNQSIISTGFNRVEKEGCQLFHAEAVAIEAACRQKKSWRLDGYAIFVTVEPCLMCFGLLRLSRITRVVYGASSPLYGFSKEVLISTEFFSVQSGLMADEASKLLNDFFKEKRKFLKG